jgi:serine/threonine protein kinase
VADLRALLESELAGPYTIGRELGGGGMATVLLAHDLKHDRPVAIKVLHPELAASRAAGATAAADQDSLNQARRRVRRRRARGRP